MKLVTHFSAIQGTPPTTVETLQAGARGAKGLDRADIVYALAVEFPRASIVYRRAEPGDLPNLSDWRRQWPDPKTLAQILVDYALIAPRPNLIVEGINEPKLNTIDDATWFGQVEAERAVLIARRGMRAGIGGFATGNPRPELFAEWARSYRAAGGPDTVVWNQHEYSHHLLEPGFGPGEDHLNLLRHRMLRAAAGQWFARVPVYIGETGLDTVDVDGLEQGKTFAASGWSQTRYWARMLKYNAFLEEDPLALMACLYSYWQPGWGKHELSKLDQFNASLVAATRATAPLVPELPLFEFAGNDITVQLAKAPGGALLPPRRLSYTVHVYEIRDGWWRVFPGATPYWMRAVPLRAV